jgi:hypothetical protein
VELALHPDHMSVDPTTKVGIGTSVLAGSLWLVKWLVGKVAELREEEKEPSQTVRTWKQARAKAESEQDDIQADIQATLRRIESRLTEADLPGIVLNQATQAAAINSIKSGQVGFREEFDQFRREMMIELDDIRRDDQVRDEQIARLTKRKQSGD